MRFGRDRKRAGIKKNQHFLPVYSVDTEEEAHTLLVLTCGREKDHETGKLEFVAKSLVMEQSLSRLYGFGHVLDRVYKEMKRRAAAKDKAEKKQRKH